VRKQALGGRAKKAKVALVDINLWGMQSRHIYLIFEFSAAACGRLLRWVPEDGSGCTRLAINADTCRTLDAVVPCQSMVEFVDANGGQDTAIHVMALPPHPSQVPPLRYPPHAREDALTN
jgi:hypothetical protein